MVSFLNKNGHMIFNREQNNFISEKDDHSLKLFEDSGISKKTLWDYIASTSKKSDRIEVFSKER
jgi:hypothetical protein